MERWLVQKFQEQGRYIVGKWWDRRGGNETDLIVVDPIAKEAWIYELKKQGYRYKEDDGEHQSSEFREKVDNVLSQTPELRKLTIHLGSLSLEDM